MSIRLKGLPKQVNILSILEYLLMLLVLLYSSMWSLFVDAKSNEFLRYAFPLLAVMIGLRLRAVKAPRWRRLVLVAALLAMYLLMTRYNLVRCVLYFTLPLLLLMLYIGLCDEKNAAFGLLYKLADIVIVLTVVSLVCYVFGTLLDILPGAQNTTYYWANYTRTCTTYYHLYYEAQTVDIFGVNLIRNCGIFTEAPGFAVFLVFALTTELFVREKPRIWRLCVLCAAVITTYSTKAILLTVVAFGLRYLITTPRTVLWRRFKTVFVPAVCLAVTAVAVILLRDKMNTVSFYIRLDDLFASFKTWATSPLFGTGYYNDDSIIARFAYPRSNNGLSAGLPILFAQGGLFLVALYGVAAVTCTLRLRGYARRQMACFFVTYFVLMSVSNMPFSFLAMLLLAFSIEGVRDSRRFAD